MSQPAKARPSPPAKAVPQPAKATPPAPKVSDDERLRNQATRRTGPAQLAETTGSLTTYGGLEAHALVLTLLDELSPDDLARYRAVIERIITKLTRRLSGLETALACIDLYATDGMSGAIEVLEAVHPDYAAKVQARAAELRLQRHEPTGHTRLPGSHTSARVAEHDARPGAVVGGAAGAHAHRALCGAQVRPMTASAWYVKSAEL